MLHALDEQGNIEWHCHTPTCQYHHCDAGVSGRPLTAHISHDAIHYTGADIVALPPCPDCGSQTFVVVQFADEHLVPPVVERDEQGMIVSVTVAGAPNFTIIKDHIERRLMHVEDLTALPDGTKLVWKDGKPYRDISQYVIDEVMAHPALSRHQQLHQQLQAIGKKHEVEL